MARVSLARASVTARPTEERLSDRAELVEIHKLNCRVRQLLTGFLRIQAME